MPEIIIPGKTIMARCRIPTPHGVCNKPFYVGEERAYRQHMIACAKAHAEAIHRASYRTRSAPLMEGGDQELVDWVADHKQEIVEGRKWIGANRSRHRPTDDVA